MKMTEQLPNQTPGVWEVDELSELLDRIWSGFARGAYSNREAFHWPAIATNTQDAPAVRTVVLRRSDRPSRLLEFHTDVRSEKLAQLRQDPRMSWFFFDAERKVQLRVEATATLHESDAHARRIWDALSPSARIIYTSNLAPGTEVDEPLSGLPSARESGPFAVPGADNGWSNFVVVSTHVTAIEFLVIGRRGQRRAQFTWDEGAQSWQSTWLIP